ncbi:MAG: methyl-accepting chemotaxis protein [Pseudomonadota bacterium]
MSVKLRLALIAGIPLFFLIASAGLAISNAFFTLGNARSAKTAVDNAQVSSSLIAELQRERGISAAFLSANGKQFGQKVAAQRRATDKALSTFNAAFVREDSDAIRTAKNSLETLESIRADVDRLNTDLTTETRVYKEMVDAQLALIAGKMAILIEGGFGDEPMAYVAILRTKEMSGLERSMGATGFAAGYFTPDVYKQFLEFRGAQTASLAPVLKLMPPAQAVEAESLLRGSRSRDILKFRRIADTAGPNVSVPEGQGQAWFDTASARIDGFTEVETQIADVLTARADEFSNAAFMKLIGTSLLMALILVSTGLFAFVTATQLSGVMNSLASGLDQLAEGKLEAKVVGVKRKDELGVMARAFKKLRTELADAEEQRTKRANALELVISSLGTGLSEISEGNFSNEIDADFSEEYTTLKDNFNTALLKMQQADASTQEMKAAQDFVVYQLEQALNALSDGDLSVRLTDPFETSYEKLRNDFNAAIEKLMSTMTTVDITGDEIKNGATDVSRAADDLSHRTERQAATLEQTTAAITEITATVTQSAGSAQNVHQIVSETKVHAEKGSEIVVNAVGAMGRIESSSNEIASIINVIDDIAFQTNLLALNAGVEAARAGDAGKGFAVVAQEVRSLAQRCTDAAKEIKQLIASSAKNVAEGVDLVNTTGESLHDIAGRIEKIASLASEIATSSNEQSSALEEVTKAVNELDMVTQKNAAMVEETTAASHQMRQTAVRLSELMSNFKLDDRARTENPTQQIENPKTVKEQQKLVTQLMTTNSTAVIEDVSEDEWKDF